MASGTTERDALITALAAAASSEQAFADWALSLIDNSQVNSDLLFDLRTILSQITFT